MRTLISVWCCPAFQPGHVPRVECLYYEPRIGYTVECLYQEDWPKEVDLLFGISANVNNQLVKRLGREG